jgi:hypothetical protein
MLNAAVLVDGRGGSLNFACQTLANFDSFALHIDIIRVLYLPTDAQESCFIKNIKIYIKTAPTCFGLMTIIRERIIRVC